MVTAVQRRRRYVKEWLLLRHRYQFGQPRRNTDKVAHGSVACTDTCIQHVIYLALGKRYSLNKIRTLSGGPTDGSRGLRPPEVMRVFRKVGLPYEVRSDLSAGDLMRIARNRGPVIVAEEYWAHPQWKGYRYLGKRLWGWAKNRAGKRIRVGYAEPLAAAGLNQPSYRLGHAVLLASSVMRAVPGRSKHVSIGFVRDPNHNTPLRPERPPWDEVTVWQLNRMLNSIRPVYGGKRLAYVPKKVVVKV